MGFLFVGRRLKIEQDRGFAIEKIGNAGFRATDPLLMSSAKV